MPSHLPASVLSSVLSQSRSSHSASARVTRTRRFGLNSKTTSACVTPRTLRPRDLSHNAEPLGARRKLKVVAATDYVHYRAAIEALLRTVQRRVDSYERERGDPASRAEQLSPADCDRIRFAIKGRRDSATPRDVFWGTGAAEEVGVQVLDQLAAANTQLKPGQAAELAKLALAGIPERP